MKHTPGNPTQWANQNDSCRTLRYAADQRLWNIASPIMDNLMDASAHIDHARHVRDFTGRMKAIVTLDTCNASANSTRPKKAIFSSRSPVAVFRRLDSVALIWKQSFTKVPGEFVVEMVFVHQDGKYRVDHALVF
jgi:hypothetical protein